MFRKLFMVHAAANLVPFTDAAWAQSKRCEVIMFKIRAHTAAMLLLGSASFFSGCASTPTRDEVKGTVDGAHTTLSNFIRDPDMTWLHRHMKEAKAVLITPRLIQAGFILGGAGGSGLVMARGRTSQAWNGPAFYTVAVGSLGLQAGVQESEMIALVMTEKGMAKLLSTSFKLGADVSVAAGPVGAGAGAPVTADMVTFVRSRVCTPGSISVELSFQLTTNATKPITGGPPRRSISWWRAAPRAPIRRRWSACSRRQTGCRRASELIGSTPGMPTGRVQNAGAAPV
jgi:lipid-binding SYLF domain-containing protein